MQSANVGSAEKKAAESDSSPGREAVETFLRRRIAELEKRVAQQGDLLREVNHRAKNNLQMAISLLSMQSLATSDPQVSEALQAAATRLGYLARVHELLHQRGDDVQEIDVGEFLREIAEALAEALHREDISLHYDIEPLVLDVDRAVNVGLIAGEAIMNAYKYAYPEPGGGAIAVTFRRHAGEVSLSVRDSGRGFDIDQNRGSLGMRLLRALGRSLGGETIVRCGSGTEVQVSFPEIRPAQA